MKRLAISISVVALLSGATPSWAADKAHQQMMAEIRMLQEQQQQLTQLIGNLADTLKSVTAKIDDQTASNRKAFADQRLLVDGMAEGVRVLREKADDTNVRLSSMTQEMEAIRQAISSMPAAASVPAPGVPPGGEPAAGNVPPTAPTAPVPMVSPDKAYNAAYADYTGGQYDLAIEGFSFYIKTFPRTDRADDAQLHIGNAYYALGNYQSAVDAFKRVVGDYPQSDSVPAAYYKMGLSYEGLKQIELAKRAYETVIKTSQGQEAQLAKQRLDSLNRR
jgi:tol-pal system protein YbgF